MPQNKAILYARVSTDDGSQNTDNQLDILRDMAKRLDCTVIREYIDHKSGSGVDREEFIAMCGDIKNNRVRRGTTLLFFSLDRLTREGAMKTLTYLNDFDTAGILYKSYTEGWLDSAGPFKDAIIALLATLAKQEKTRIGERTRAGLARVRREGSKSGKPIGRPKNDIDIEHARELLKTKSERKVAVELGIPLSTLRSRLHGRSVVRAKHIWSDPIHGEVDENGIFGEASDGTVVIRYDRTSGLPWCLNHQVVLEKCRDRHMGGTL